MNEQEQMDELDKKRRLFISLVTELLDFRAFTMKLSKRLKAKDLPIENLWNENEVYETVILNKIVDLMNANNISDIVSDDWFWLDWTNTRDCFMFVYGLTVAVREENEVNNID